MAETTDWCPTVPTQPDPQDLRQLLGCAPSAMDHLAPTPYDIEGMLRQVLVHHFAAAAQISHPMLRELVWRDGPNTSILIESVDRFLPETAEKQPAIYIKDNAYRQQRLTIGDRTEANLKGENRYALLWVGSHTIFCLREEAAAAKILGHEVATILTHFAPVIRPRARLHRLQVVEVGASRPIPKVRRSRLVPVTVGWAYEDSWVLTQEARPANSFGVDVSHAS